MVTGDLDNQAVSEVVTLRRFTQEEHPVCSPCGHTNTSVKPQWGRRRHFGFHLKFVADNGHNGLNVEKHCEISASPFTLVYSPLREVSAVEMTDRPSLLDGLSISALNDHTLPEDPVVVLRSLREKQESVSSFFPI